MMTAPLSLRSLLSLLPLLLFGCKEDLDAGTDFEGGWEIQVGVLDAGLIGVWAPGDDDVWAVGADPDDGMGGYVFHYDGLTWERMDTGTTGDFWWVHGDGSGRVWMVGMEGLIVRYEPETGFTQIQSPEEVNLFGAFAFAEDDVFACGGNNVSTSQKQVLWHFDGESWDLPQGFVNDRDTDTVLTKMFARTSDELWAVGGPDQGLHMKDDVWEVLDMGTDTHLTTVHGNSDLLIAAGGLGRGGIVEDAGDGFVEVDIGDIQPLNGVAVHADGRAVASGWFGTLLTRDIDGNWELVEEVDIRDQVFHSVSVSPGGHVYAAGAIFGLISVYDGILLRGELPTP